MEDKTELEAAFDRMMSILFGAERDGATVSDAISAVEDFKNAPRVTRATLSEDEAAHGNITKAARQVGKSRTVERAVWQGAVHPVQWLQLYAGMSLSMRSRGLDGNRKQRRAAARRRTK